MTPKRLCLLGATGTIGQNTLDVVRNHADKVSIFALTANTDINSMAKLCTEFKPKFAAMADEASANQLREVLPASGTEVLSGINAISELAAHDGCTDVMSAIVGGVGLAPTLAAINAGKRTMVANKEPLVMAGKLVMQACKSSGAKIIPVDSEHNAIFQCLSSEYICGSKPEAVRKLVLTASGGPFRDWEIEKTKNATVEQALSHPNWVMGRKISIDSATMMNKGLELIEAHWLFALPQEQIDIVLHPESVIHSMVEFDDGSSIAQLGEADMRVPIANALGWPQRWESGVNGVDLIKLGNLSFRELDAHRYPCMQLARDALSAGCWASNALNAANEIAVDAFLNGQIMFSDIYRVNQTVLEKSTGQNFSGTALDSLDTVLGIDAWARNSAHSEITTRVAANA